MTMACFMRVIMTDVVVLIIMMIATLSRRGRTTLRVGIKIILGPVDGFV